MATRKEIAWITDEDCKLQDNAKLIFGDGADRESETVGDLYMAWDGTDFDITQAGTNSAINIGVDGAGMDFKLFGDTASAYLLWDQSADDLILSGAAGLVMNGTAGISLGDDVKLSFGASSDITIDWNAAGGLDVLQAAANSMISLGVDNAGIDVKFFGDTASSYMLWDQSGDELIFEGADLWLKDSDQLEFGDASDVVMAWDGTDFDITAAADDSVLKIGNGTNDFDVWVYGNIATAYTLFDAGSSSVQLWGPTRPQGFNGLSPRFELAWLAGAEGLVGVNADATDGADHDQVSVAPHLDATQSVWSEVTWGTDTETHWECDISTGAAITNCIIWAGLKLTNTSTTATDADQVFFRYQNGVNGGEWQAVSSIADSDDEHDTNVAVQTATRYHLKIEVASDRTARMYINGALVETTAALTDATDLIPYIGVQSEGAAEAKTLYVHGQAISRAIG